MRQCLLYQSDRPIPYQSAWQWQKDLVAARKQDESLPDVLLLMEHPPVYTLGQGSSLEFLKFELDAPGIECHRIERGGEVTYHAPGQIVGYPILNLNFYQRDLHWYLRQLEEIVILTLVKYGVLADRIPGLTGVWVSGEKIAQVGIKVSRWVTMHGFALNVDMDLAGFDRIVPCGIRDRACCQLAQFVPDIDIELVKVAIAQSFALVFDVEFHLLADTSER
ncbi:lipoyl(octanoyl) transferase LipB [Pseudanabaena sp. PCC 6802]|uniref:lipoyl(octanoyl) transferase LipB n=1 Tax=Pseudanabaena sp. PCC 6802 TaxID=118173 RepID=UPI00034627CA|nr:lipoyl(octanoyl) transferase LipB [Pseudanabaena sp. PCC 6802]